MIKLSIIIPVYNVEPYIRACLDSIFMQDVSNDSFEVIVIDDETPDYSMNIVNEFVNTQLNIRIFHQKNQGLSISRNVGLRESRGKYVWFVDSDDWIEDNSLNLLFDLIDKHDADVYVTTLAHVKENCNIKTNDFCIQNDFMISGKNYLFHKMPYGATQRFILKRDFLVSNSLEFYPGILHEDGEFGPRMLYFADKVYVLKQSIYNYRLRTSGSIMSTWKKKNSEDLILIHKKLESFCNGVFVNNFDKYNFKCVIFDTLLASILFAKNEWKSKDFILFYNKNKKYIKAKGKEQINFTFKNSKNILKGLLIYISPFLFVKYRRLYKTLIK